MAPALSSFSEEKLCQIGVGRGAALVDFERATQVPSGLWKLSPVRQDGPDATVGFGQTLIDREGGSIFLEGIIEPAETFVAAGQFVVQGGIRRRELNR